MRKKRHALSGAIYEVRDDGLVYVENDGTWGAFEPDGTWVKGKLREADPHLCGWIGGAQLPPEYAVATKDLPMGPPRVARETSQ